MAQYHRDCFNFLNNAIIQYQQTNMVTSLKIPNFSRINIREISTRLHIEDIGQVINELGFHLYTPDTLSLEPHTIPITRLFYIQRILTPLSLGRYNTFTDAVQDIERSRQNVHEEINAYIALYR
ncbi:hypothetical protein [Xenorhabdus bharatensis]|uniref:hypothetical protein n=1 Tax=Xenorhabdus bharatensis TaxID=3136256 RepID=UPI0030F425E9